MRRPSWQCPASPTWKRFLRRICRTPAPRWPIFTLNANVALEPPPDDPLSPSQLLPKKPVRRSVGDIRPVRHGGPPEWFTETPLTHISFPPDPNEDIRFLSSSPPENTVMSLKKLPGVLFAQSTSTSSFYIHVQSGFTIRHGSRGGFRPTSAIGRKGPSPRSYRQKSPPKHSSASQNRKTKMRTDVSLLLPLSPCSLGRLIPIEAGPAASWDVSATGRQIAPPNRRTPARRQKKFGLFRINTLYPNQD